VTGTYRQLHLLHLSTGLFAIDRSLNWAGDPTQFETCEARSLRAAWAGAPIWPQRRIMKQRTAAGTHARVGSPATRILSRCTRAGRNSGCFHLVYPLPRPLLEVQARVRASFAGVMCPAQAHERQCELRGWHSSSCTRTSARTNTGDDPRALTTSSGLWCRSHRVPCARTRRKRTTLLTRTHGKDYHAPNTSALAHRSARKQAPRSVAQFLLPFSHTRPTCTVPPPVSRRPPPSSTLDLRQPPGLQVETRY
jgi:hypothetical protein